MNLDGLRVLIAGGTSGIGLATARVLCSRGAAVLVASRSRPPAPAISGLPHVACDLRSRRSWDRLLAEMVQLHAGCDVLIHSVGVLVPGQLDHLPSSAVQTVIETNFSSAVHALQAVVPCMRRQGYGMIIILGSLGGIVPMPYGALYAATKFALRGLVLSAAPELKKEGIDICLVSPGPVYTRMLVREAEDERCTLTFVERPMHAEQVAQTIARLLLHPRLETVLPAHAEFPSRLLGAFPTLLRFCFPLLRFLGTRHLRAFQSTGLQTGPVPCSLSSRRMP